MENSHRQRALDWLWFLVFGAASSLWCWTAAGRLGATFDEPIYIARGLESWRTGSQQGLLRLGTMPLPINLTTLPIFLTERWHGVAFDPVRDLHVLLPVARTMTLVFWWLLLAYARLAGRQLAGPWGGRLAVALLAVEPSLLAHASLATTDLAVTACLVALVYHFRTGREAGWGRRIGIPALWLAASVLAKASGLVFGPLCLAAVEAERLLRAASACEAVWQPANSDRHIANLSPPLSPVLTVGLRAFRRDAVRIAMVAMVVVFLYCGCDWQTEPSFIKWAYTLPEGPGRQAMVWFSEHLRIFSNAGEGLVRQVKHNLHGHGTYLLGQVAARSVWYYFPVALTVKLSLPLLLLPLILAARRFRSLANWAFCTAVVLLVFSVTCRVQIGIRLVLPLVALLAVGIAAALAGAMTLPRPSHSFRARLAHGLPALAAVGLLWNGAACCRVWPDALGYTNLLWGGTQRGYLALSDSNYDWGQGVPELERWQESHGKPPLEVWYFGTDPELDRLPLRQVRFHEGSVASGEDLRACLQGHYLAVSTTVLYGSLRTLLLPGSREARSFDLAVGFLQHCRPVDRTRTFLIYDFRGSEPGGVAARFQRAGLYPAPGPAR
jgi:hypothetical protein